MENERLKELGKKVLLFRVEKGMTITELSEKARVSFSTISSLENGKCPPRASTLYKLAIILEVDPKELLDYLN